MKLPTFRHYSRCGLVMSCLAICAAILPAHAQAPAASAKPSWVDSAPTEPPQQYGRFAQRVGNGDTVAVLKFERVSSHDTKNYPVIIQSSVGTSLSGQTVQTNPAVGFDTTSNLLGTTSFRSNMTFSQDLAIYAQGTLRLTKRTPFSPQIDAGAWNQVQGGKLKTTTDFATISASLLRTTGVRKMTYPHPISSFGLVLVHDLNILTGRVHFVALNNGRVRTSPVTAVFEYTVSAQEVARRESIVSEGCTSQSIPLKLPTIPFGGEAELLSFSVVDNRATSRNSYCN